MRLTLTEKEARWAEWAIGPMEEYWEELVADGSESEVPALPRLTRGRYNIWVLTLPSPCPEGVLEDFLYRLEDQAPAVAETDAESERQVADRARSALSLAGKLRKATTRS